MLSRECIDYVLSHIPDGDPALFEYVALTELSSYEAAMSEAFRAAAIGGIAIAMILLAAADGHRAEELMDKWEGEVIHPMKAAYPKSNMRSVAGVLNWCEENERYLESAIYFRVMHDKCKIER